MKTAKRLIPIHEYYFSKKLREVSDLEAQGKPIINMGIGNPDLPPPKSVQDAIAQSVADQTTHGYQPYKGIDRLRQAMASFYAKHYNVILNPKTEILPLSGSKEGIMLLSMAYLNPGDKVLIPNPAYPTYTSICKLVDAVPLYYNLNPENDWAPDFQELEKLDLRQVKIMWVNYPNMPTGATGSEELFIKLVHFTKKHNILLINDNPYSFILTEKPISILTVEGATDVVIELNSLSKSHNMAGWRVGMLVGSQTHIENVLKIRSNMNSGLFLGIQAGAIAALKIGDDWYKRLNNHYKKRRLIVWDILDKLNYSYNRNSAGLFVWASIPSGKKSENVTDDLLYEKHIFVTPGSIFGSNGEGYLRFSLCQPEAKLKEVLARLSQ